MYSVLIIVAMLTALTLMYRKAKSFFRELLLEEK